MFHSWKEKHETQFFSAKMSNKENELILNCNNKIQNKPLQSNNMGTLFIFIFIFFIFFYCGLWGCDILLKPFEKKK